MEVYQYRIHLGDVYSKNYEIIKQNNQKQEYTHEILNYK